MNELSKISSTFLTIANEEYEAITTYCNSLSNLSYAIHGPPLKQQQQQQQQTQTQTTRANNTTTPMDPNLFLQKSSFSSSSHEAQISALIDYQNSLRILQTIHSKLIQCHDGIIKKQHPQHNQNDNNNDTNYNNNNNHETNVISNHLELSTRVLKTCASSMKNGYGPLYENGLLKNLGGSRSSSSSSSSGKDSESVEDWHEIRIVSLTAYRGSISRLKLFIENE